MLSSYYNQLHTHIYCLQNLRSAVTSESDRRKSFGTAKISQMLADPKIWSEPL